MKDIKPEPKKISLPETLMAEWTKHQELMGELSRHSRFTLEDSSVEVVLNDNEIYLQKSGNEIIKHIVKIAKLNDGKWLCGSGVEFPNNYGYGGEGTFRDPNFDKTFKPNEFEKALEYGIETMEFKGCEGRRLNKLDSWPLEDINEKLRNDDEDKDRIMIIPAHLDQAYLIPGNIDYSTWKLINHVYKFGLPHEVQDYTKLWTVAAKELLIKCCRSKRCCLLNLEGGLYASPIHDALDLPGIIKDLSPILSISEYQIVFPKRYEPYVGESIKANGTFLGLIKIKAENYDKEYGEAELSIWESVEKNGEKKTTMIHESFWEGRGIELDEEPFIKKKFENLKRTLFELCYSSKVQDVIGGFEL
jgi:hypothetical protein